VPVTPPIPFTGGDKMGQRGPKSSGKTRAQIKKDCREKALQDPLRAFKYRAGYQRKWAQKVRDKVIEKLGGRCSSPNCGWINSDGSQGCTDRRCLQVDHVRGDGSSERKNLNYFQIYQKVLLDAEGRYQLLCANCNWIKKNLNQEVPKSKITTSPGLGAIGDSHDRLFTL